MVACARQHAEGTLPAGFHLIVNLVGGKADEYPLAGNELRLRNQTPGRYHARELRRLVRQRRLQAAVIGVNEGLHIAANFNCRTVE